MNSDGRGEPRKKAAITGAKCATAENRPLLSVVVPVYNAAGLLKAQHRQITAALAGRFPYEVVYVDDASADESLAVLQRLASQDKTVRVVALARNSGQQAATLCGLAHARGRAIANMDDDCQHPAALLPVMLRLLHRRRLDIVYAVPGRAVSSPVRLLGGALRDGFFAFLYHKPAGVRVSSFRVMTSNLARRVLAKQAGFNYFSAMVFSAPVRAATITYPYRPRPAGVSGYTLGKRAKLYAGILLHYGPLGRLLQTPARPAPIKEKIGFG